MAEKLIFPIGFDLEEGVREASKEWKSTYQKQLQKAIDDKPLKAKIELETKGLDLGKLNEFNKISKEMVAASKANTKIQRDNIAVQERQRLADERVAAAHERTLASVARRKKAEEGLNRVYKTQSGYLQRLFQRMVAYASVTQAFSFIRNIREVTAQFELQRVALGSIIGDLNEANAMFEQIKAAAVKSPFQIKELVTYTKNLAAYKIESDELFETTQRLADISAGLGVGMERLVLAYGQIRATGYLRASEVRQLTEAGIPIVEELAKKMSDLRGETVSAAEVMGMISERAISFGMVKEVFDDMTSAGGMFYKMQEKQAETLAGQWSNLQDAISIMYEEIGNTEGVNNSIKGTIGLVKSLAENWRVVGDVAVWSVGAAMGYAKVIKPISELIQKHRLLNKVKQSEIYVENNLARIRELNAEKAAYIAEGLAVEDDGYLQWIDEKIKYHQDLADKHTKIASEAKKSATALKGFGGALKSIGSFIKTNWVGMLITAVTALVSWLISARQEAKRLNEELEKIGTEGALQADQSVRNFERLAKAVRESADGSEKQTTALAELKRSYGDLLPSQDKEIRNIVQEKSNYDALIGSIRKKIELQIQEQKLNTIASEYGSRFTKWEGKIKKESIFGSLSTQEIDIFISEIKKAVDEGIIATTNDAETNGLELKRILEGIVGDAYGSLSNTYFANIRPISKLIETQEEYNKSIDSVGGALDRLDDKGKNLSDTFNTWQKELASITEGKNLKGEGIRLFDDESITQINKLTDATARVADEYDKLAKEKKEVDKALLSEGARADKDTYAKLQDRLGKINEGMSGLYDFLKKYGALDLIKSDDKGQKYAYQALKDELAAVEKIYKRYQDLRKLKSETDTQSILAKEFKGVSLNTLSKAYSPEQMLAVYEEALAEAQRLGKKDLVLEIQTKIGEFNVAEEERKLEKRLKDLSDSISRTKTAKEFFDRMLGMTGDKEFSASLTLSVYGEGGDLGKKLAKQTIEQLETAFEGVDISSAIDKTTGKVDYAKLAPLVEQLPEKAQANAQALVNAGEKANADWLTDLQKTYQKVFTFEERRTQVMKEEAQKRKEIEESASLTPEQKAKYTEASRKKEAERISAINIEEFKESEDYLKIFEDIERLSIPTIKRLIAKLREVIATNKELSATDLKHLTEQINKLEDGLVKKDAWAGLLSGIRDLQKARKTISQTTKGTKEYADAMDDANKANVKIQNALGGLQSEFSQAQQLIESFADTLGIAEDSDFGVFLNGMAEAVGGVSKALAFAQLAVQLFDGTIKSFLASNPIGWILLIVSAIISAVQAIMNARVNRINEEIERSQDHLDNLEYSYERLQKAQEKAFGSDYISNYEQRLANLEAQQEAYIAQADAERSKGKKADVDKIKEYEEQARATADAIKDMQSELSEYFLGTDLTSAARDFANAWIDAYKEFSNTTDAMKEKFQDMIENMIVESVLAAQMKKALAPVFRLIDNMGTGDFYDEGFWANVVSAMNTATDASAEGAEILMKMLEQYGVNVRSLGGNMTGISRDIATASEKSILGLAAGINTQNFYISQVPTKLDTIIGLLRGGSAVVDSGVNVQDLITIQNQFLSHLPTIAQNTAETVARCERAAVACESMASKLNSAIKPIGTTHTHSVNVTMSS